MVMDPGNTRSSARLISSNVTFSNSVSSKDRFDFFRFSLVKRSSFRATLTRLKDNADLSLLNSAGAVLAQSRQAGSSSEDVSTNLDAGVYYIRVSARTRRGSTTYRLKLSTSELVDPKPVVDPDGTFETAAELGTVGVAGSLFKSDSIGTAQSYGRDENDYSRFSITDMTNLRVSINNLTQNANFELFNSDRLRIGAATLDGTATDSINLNVAPGLYYVRVVPGDALASTDYGLSITTSSPPPSPQNTPPTLTNNTGLRVSRAVETTISNSRLLATDQEQQAGQLVYTLNELPASGVLLRDGLVLRSNATFTQADIDGGLLKYKSYMGATQLTHSSISGKDPRVSGNNVVWVGNDRNSGERDNEIYFYNGTLGNTIRITNNNFDDKFSIYPTSGFSTISGSNVVWVANDGNDYEIFFYSPGSGVQQLTNNEFNDDNPQIFGSNVVWQGFDGNNDEIYWYNDITKETTLLTTDPSDFDRGGTEPKIWGSKIVWSGSYEAGRRKDVFVYDILTKRIIGQLGNSFANESDLQISASGSRYSIVWVGADSGADNDDLEIFFYSFDENLGSTSLVNNPINLTNNNNDLLRDDNPAISGSNIVWEGRDRETSQTDTEIFFSKDNGTTRVTTQLTQNNSIDSIPKISGGNIVWVQSSQGADREIFFYNSTAGGNPVSLTNNAFDDYSPQISGSNVVWEGYDRDDEIFYGNFANNDSFSFTVSDGMGGATSGMFTIDIASV
jgi:Cadherin-like/Bacterial pre-peptidase C-terminal domain